MSSSSFSRGTGLGEGSAIGEEREEKGRDKDGESVEFSTHKM